MSSLRFNLIFFLSVILGLFVAWLDGRTNWDDAGITVGLIFIFSILSGFFAGQKPWLIALGVSVWVSLFGLINGNMIGLIALIPGFLGAYLGNYFNTAIRKL